jgi:hypothetical protein
MQVFQTIDGLELVKRRQRRLARYDEGDVPGDVWMFDIVGGFGMLKDSAKKGRYLHSTSGSVKFACKATTSIRSWV